MKIIKQGNMKRSCPYCGTEVELDLEDIKTRQLTEYIYDKYYVCPCCGREIHDI